MKLRLGQRGGGNWKILEDGLLKESKKVCFLTRVVYN
jgi:hypothetical protein